MDSNQGETTTKRPVEYITVPYIERGSLQTSGLKGMQEQKRESTWTTWLLRQNGLHHTRNKDRQQICGGSYTSTAIIRDNQGNMLTSDKEQERRRAEHFEEMLNRDNLSDLPHIQQALEDLDFNVEPLRNALLQLSRN